MQMNAAPLSQTAAPEADRPAGLLRHLLRLLIRQRDGGLYAIETERGGLAFMDSFLFLLVVCAMLLPTTAGYELASAAAESVIGLPFAVMMFLSPFAVMALLPLRLLQLTLDGLFGIRLRLGLLAPLSLVCLAIFLFLGPLSLRPAPEIVVSTTAEILAEKS